MFFKFLIIFLKSFFSCENGAKFDEITYQSIKSDSGASINMCENCVHTFVEYLQSLAGRCHD